MGEGSGDHREADCSKAIRGDLVLFPSAAVSKCPRWEAANKEEEEILEGGGRRKCLDTSYRCIITTVFRTGNVVACQFSQWSLIAKTAIVQKTVFCHRQQNKILTG